MASNDLCKRSINSEQIFSELTRLTHSFLYRFYLDIYKPDYNLPAFFYRYEFADCLFDDDLIAARRATTGMIKTPFSIAICIKMNGTSRI